MLLNPYRFSPTLTSSILAVSTTNLEAIRFYKTSDYATYSVLPSPPSTDRVGGLGINLLRLPKILHFRGLQMVWIGQPY